MNIFHCCVQKTASRWVKKILTDPRILTPSGLAALDYELQLPGKVDARKLTEKRYSEPFPSNTLVLPLYLSYDSFCSIPKPEAYRAFFVMRDPRDIVVSWYFSVKHSHSVAGSIDVLRGKLNELPLPEGLAFAMQQLYYYGLFDSLDSWIEASAQDPNVKLMKYEDLTGPHQVETWQALLDHCQISIPTDTLHQVLVDHRFENLAKRKKGEEDTSSHWRKGVPGDWLNYFDEETFTAFAKWAGGDLPTRLGYGTREQVVKSVIERLQTELWQTQTLNHQQQERLVAQEQHLHQLQAEVGQLRGRIDAMQTSKFWQARQAWFRLRHKVGISGD